MNRREFARRSVQRFVGGAAASAVIGLQACSRGQIQSSSSRPNILFVFADQMRASAAGWMGNEQVRAPHLDRFARRGLIFDNAVSCNPVCTPYRASLLTGLYPLRHGLCVNDVRLSTDLPTIAKSLKAAGYDTGYIGKWHLDGDKRGGFTPPGPRRQGFDYWAAAECTHNYMKSHYYRDDPTPIWIEGYDADHQTDLAIEYVRTHGAERPFCLFMSWGPPHDPYQLMPEKYKTFDPREIKLPPNCKDEQRWREDIAGYYSHIEALDRNFGRLMDALEKTGRADDTIVVFTSDHGDMLGSHGMQKKQKPWDESVHIPFVLVYPRRVPAGRRTPVPFNVPDIMPTLLGLACVPIPRETEGYDLSDIVLGQNTKGPASTLIANHCPFGEPVPEWRGVRTERYTFVRTRSGPWLLFDNQKDPYQMNNLAESASHREIREELDRELTRWLERTGDRFEPREAYWKQFGYKVNEKGVVPYETRVGIHDL
ncbi:MAG: sulfatase [Candidatus Sumerlaeia bacterium]|nr:sulfatase [Candidatus Sumerlaeia bacterium]